MIKKFKAWETALTLKFGKEHKFKFAVISNDEFKPMIHLYMNDEKLKYEYDVEALMDIPSYIKVMDVDREVLYDFMKEVRNNLVIKESYE